MNALRALSPPQAAAASLPAVLHVLALPTMPALHMHGLQHIAHLVEVQVCVFNPSQECWFKLIDLERLRHLAARQPQRSGAGGRADRTWGRKTQGMDDSLADAGDQHPAAQAGDNTDFEPRLPRLPRWCVPATSRRASCLDRAEWLPPMQAHCCGVIFGALVWA